MQKKYCIASADPNVPFPYLLTYPDAPIPVRFDTVEEAMGWATALGKTCTLVHVEEVATIVATMGITDLPDEADREAWFVDNDAGVLRLRANWEEIRAAKNAAPGT